VNAEHILFWFFAAGTVISAAGVLLTRNPVASAMSLVASFFFLSGIYVLLWAHTIAVLQVLVYAGAIMVLFLFVIMLLSLTDTGSVWQFTFGRILGAISCAALCGGLFAALNKIPQTPGGPAWMADNARVASFGTLQELGAVLYTQWLFPFEAVSLLLLVAIVGAVVVAKSRI
jgi:NADH-quinone oxidoreductase subunit J